MIAYISREFKGSSHLIDDVEHWKNNSPNEVIVTSSKWKTLFYSNKQKVFFGFNERKILFLVITVALSRRNIYLLLTNNLAKGRQAKIKLIYWGLKYLSKVNFIIHSEYEKKFLKSLGVPDFRIKIRPHWLLIKNSFRNSAFREHDVAFFGPVKIDKDIIGFNDFFDLKIPFKSILAVKLNSCFGDHLNVTRVDAKLDRKEWLDLFRSSKLVFIPLNLGYEGKLSGIFMDSISCGCQVIISNIEPYRTMVNFDRTVKILNKKYIHIQRPEKHTVNEEYVRTFYANYE